MREPMQPCPNCDQFRDPATGDCLNECAGKGLAAPEPPEPFPAALLAAHITTTAVFVPFSASRNAVPNPRLRDLSVNWRITVYHHGKPILTTDYQQGIAHCPHYSQRLTADIETEIRYQVETGRYHSRPGSIGGTKPLPAPTTADILHCLLSDSSVLDYPCFEDWAAEFGYDPDSRSGESVYRACLSTALTLRAALSDSLLTTLTAASSDY